MTFASEILNCLVCPVNSNSRLLILSQVHLVSTSVSMFSKAENLIKISTWHRFLHLQHLISWDWTCLCAVYLVTSRPTLTDATKYWSASNSATMNNSSLRAAYQNLINLWFEMSNVCFLRFRNIFWQISFLKISKIYHSASISIRSDLWKQIPNYWFENILYPWIGNEL
jgi:hypothetical protein